MENFIESWLNVDSALLEMAKCIETCIGTWKKAANVFNGGIENVRTTYFAPQAFNRLHEKLI